MRKYCECGNYIIESKETVSENTTGNISEEESQTGMPETVESISDNQTEAIDGGKI